jgi:hypothetical protein
MSILRWRWWRPRGNCCCRSAAGAKVAPTAQLDDLNQEKTMPRKKKTSATAAAPAANLATLKIGSHVRCTDDGVSGRIVWANAVSVKIRWDDGEQVSWRRDSLAGRPIVIIDAADEPDRSAAPPNPVETERSQPTTGRAAKRERRPTAAAVPAVQALSPPVGPAAPPTGAGSAGAAAPPAAPRKRSGDTGVGKKLSALDAAARVLAEAGGALNCQQMIAAMAAKGYWTSPGGKTPWATLYSAILRELATQGVQARFVKTQRGQFARNGAV